MKRLLILIPTAAVLMLTAQTGHAGMAVGADAKLGILTDKSEDSTGLGFGFDLKLGYNADVLFLVVQPEAMFSMMHFDGDDDPHNSGNIVRGMIGGLVGIDLGLMPFIYAHMGFGRFNRDEPIDASESGFTYDVGLGLDLTILPILNLGVSFGFSHLAAEDDATWIDMGVHASLVF